MWILKGKKKTSINNANARPGLCQAALLICLEPFFRLTARSPEMLAPARMPVAAGKKMAKTEKKVSPLKSGIKFSSMIPAVKDRKIT